MDNQGNEKRILKRGLDEAQKKWEEISCH